MIDTILVFLLAQMTLPIVYFISGLAAAYAYLKTRRDPVKYLAAAFILQAIITPLTQLLIPLTIHTFPFVSIVALTISYLIFTLLVVYSMILFVKEFSLEVR